MSDTVLKIENVSKQYRLGELGTGTISHDLNRWWHLARGKDDPYAIVGGVNDRSKAAEEDYVWALKDINFEVNEGDVIGIIGKNGAGKSTLLKLLSQVTNPTTGYIGVKGRIASLLEVGTGFHPELTGRDNIYLNGSILGMTKWEIKSKLEQIIEFAGVAKYIDTPVKRYSSGMKVRLGFAVAAHLEPEILVVDEVLAVGDAEFQKKAIGKMKDVSQGEGRTVLFVSHNMSSIRNLCTRAVVLTDGKTSFDGSTEDGISFYLNDNSHDSLLAVNHFEQTHPIAHFVSAKIQEGEKIEFLNDSINIRTLVKISIPTRGLFVMVGVWDQSGNLLIASSTDEQEASIFANIASEGEYLLNMSIPGKILRPGDYRISLSIRTGSDGPFHKEESALNFQIIDSETYRGVMGRYRSQVMVAPEVNFSMVKN